MKTTQLIDLFQVSRRGSELAVIEGFQALKHAARFKAELLHVVSCDDTAITNLAEKLAPDVSEILLRQTVVVDEATFYKLSPQPPRTKVIALAKRKHYSLDSIAVDRPIVFLEDPKDLENIGAVIRVAAAADAGAVVVSGKIDVWHPAVIRGAAGLHFALPVLNNDLEVLRPRKIPIGAQQAPSSARTPADKQGDRIVISLDPEGENIREASIPKNAILIFGTERHGITEQTLQLSDKVVSLPMKEGVSSLNLATSVAATLYML